MRRCNRRFRRRGGLDFIAFRIDHPCARLITCLELDLAFKSLYLLLIEKVAVLITVFNTLLTGKNSLAGRGWRAGYIGLSVFNRCLLLWLFLNNRGLGWGRRICNRWVSWWCLLSA